SATRMTTVLAPTARITSVFRRANREKALFRDKKTGTLDRGLITRCVRKVSATVAMTRSVSRTTSSHGASTGKILSDRLCGMAWKLPFVDGVENSTMKKEACHAAKSVWIT